MVSLLLLLLSSLLPLAPISALLNKSTNGVWSAGSYTFVSIGKGWMKAVYRAHSCWKLANNYTCKERCKSENSTGNSTAYRILSAMGDWDERRHRVHGMIQIAEPGWCAKKVWLFLFCCSSLRAIIIHPMIHFCYIILIQCSTSSHGSLCSRRRRRVWLQ